jgi:ABC-type multidrug transport system ATPase subunit
LAARTFIYQDVEMPAQTQNQSQQKAQTQSVLASGLTKKYGATQALAGLDLEIPRGQCLALLGPNGAGKSTTIKILAGMIEPDSGSVQIFGKSWKQEAKKLRQSVGLVMQKVYHLRNTEAVS